ncbi:uncharacterized protein [Prorops nasuta]|uniref:uncharacterized protein n=1 Tax=Prorops nasuta TaxID=863751 RepID=UPI0034CEDC92
MDNTVELNGKYQWDENSTKLLIEEVRSNFGRLENNRIIQKTVWNEIAVKFRERGYNITSNQCNIKFKNLKKKYKEIKDILSQTGGAPVYWQHFEIMDELLRPLPEITPISLGSSTSGFRLSEQANINNHRRREDDSSSEDEIQYLSGNENRNRPRRRRQRTSSITNQDLYEQRERHHAENMEIKKQFLNLFQQYLNKDH